MTFRIFVAFALIFSAVASAADKPVPQVKRALIISVDGLRPDLMLRAKAPRMQAMLDRGSYSMWAKTTPGAITLPSHVSMLTGVPPEWHGIMWNHELPLKEAVYPNFPTLFELAKRQKMSTAVVAGKTKFNVLDKPGVLDWKFFASTSTDSDNEVIATALKILRDHQPDVMLVHFAIVDVAGHGKGWGSPEQMAAIEATDKSIAQIFDALDELKLADSTFIILSADHGGAGRTHGPEDPRSRIIPWIAMGPGIRKNFDLTLLGADSNIETYDTFTTTCTMLGIPFQRNVKGKFIPQILENPELVRPQSDATTQPNK
ncbi:MAG: alkaline phosphatase family protein [Anaerolineae bacterium]|nr:alkaline phosphatase family protein [Phycisphaerae bacterium]